MLTEAMECSDEMEDMARYPTDMCKVIYFFRNKCSKVLAELLVRELKNCGFVMEFQEKETREEVNSFPLFRLLKNASTRGKRKGKKKSDTPRQPSATSDTLHLNNLEDNEGILTSIQLGQILTEEVSVSSVMEPLTNLDSAFLLCVLTNGILDFPHTPEVREALGTLREIRNSILHGDSNRSTSSPSEQLSLVCASTKVLCKYLGRDEDDACYKIYMSDSQSNFCPLFRDIREELHAQYRNLHPERDSHQHPFVCPSIKHVTNYNQTDEIVENLMGFLAKNQVSRSEEPRPVLLCGAHGAGKSTVLNHLLQHVCEETLSCGKFSLVVKVDEHKTKLKDIFWQNLFSHLADMCPQAVEKHGKEKVINTLSVYSNKSNFLFLMDQNLQDPGKLVHLMPLMDHGTWVLSYQGVAEPSTFYRVLKMESLYEEQVLHMLRGITGSEEQYRMVSHMYKTCSYKGLIDTPDMVYIFSKVCLELKDCVPFYELVDKYICKNVPATPQNEVELTKLGGKAMDIIQYNKEYYSSEALAGIDSGVTGALMEYNMKFGFFFKYRVVQDYLAAMYVVRHTKEGCELWLKQVNLFRRVFEIVCALWSREEGGICRNLHHIQKYLEKLFEISKGSQKKKKKEKMEVDDAEDVNKDTGSQPSFVRWIFLANLAEEHQNNQDMLHLLAQLLACKSSWLFKCKSLTEKCLDNLSLVFRHIKLTKELTITMVSGPNVAMLTKLWVVLSGHEGVCTKTSVRLVVHHTEKNWFMYDKDLKLLPATVAKTTSPLFITKFVGPLLCSESQQFLRCFCMRKLDVLEAYIYDLDSLREVLGLQEELRSIFVKVNFRMEEMHIPDIMIKLSSSFPFNLTITYFQDLQKLLNMFESPHHLVSLRIYKVYIHENFSLDLRHFKKLKFLAIRFCDTGRLPSVYLDEPEQEKNMEVDLTKKDRKVWGLPLEQWVLRLALNTHLPDGLERLLLRNLSFCNDSNIPVMNKYWSGLPFQRLVLLDTQISMSMFRKILKSLVFSDTDSRLEEITQGVEKKCRLENAAESQRNAVKQERLVRQEREEKRRKKPVGQEVIITSEIDLCSKCHCFSCSCDKPSINHCQDTYQDFVTLVNDMYSYQILSIDYSSNDVSLRKDVCGDLHVKCPLALLDDEMVQQLESLDRNRQELQNVRQVLGALALAQAITLTHTSLSHEGALSLLQYLKHRKQCFGRIEPFRITIFSDRYHMHRKSVEEMKYGRFLREVRADENLQQFNFRCGCSDRCHNFKKAINGCIYFNKVILFHPK